MYAGADSRSPNVDKRWIIRLNPRALSYGAQLYGKGNIMAKTIMVQGTASGVGKTIITLALCRIFSQDGYRVAPFKPQNMTANTIQTSSGEEIAISQYLQACAAGALPDARMNPVILKPPHDKMGTIVMLNGRLYDMVSDVEYKDLRKTLLPEIMDAYNSLSEQYDIIVIEGAGSPVELNLNDGDIVNMGIARRTLSPVLLVSDIDRGGVFASLYGTISLLSEEERIYVKALIVNRFKGERALFSEGKNILERITGVPVAGIVPFIGIDLSEEDGLGDKPNKPLGPDSDTERQFDMIADTVRSSLNMELLYKILDEGIA